MLAAEGAAPGWFAELSYVAWSGPTKDLRNVSSILGQALLLDDHRPYVHPGQEKFWVEISLFGSPYPANDSGLSAILAKISTHLTAHN